MTKSKGSSISKHVLTLIAPPKTFSLYIAYLYYNPSIHETPVLKTQLSDEDSIFHFGSQKVMYTT
jgi:hypothetical protein